jgi:hypothetical protein
MKIPIVLDLQDLVNEIDRETAIVLIEKIDTNMAEVDFTVKVLKMLVDSLKNDESEENIREWIGL